MNTLLRFFLMQSKKLLLLCALSFTLEGRSFDVVEADTFFLLEENTNFHPRSKLKASSWTDFIVPGLDRDAISFTTRFVDEALASDRVAQGSHLLGSNLSREVFPYDRTSVFALNELPDVSINDRRGPRNGDIVSFEEGLICRIEGAEERFPLYRLYEYIEEQRERLSDTFFDELIEFNREAIGKAIDRNKISVSATEAIRYYLEALSQENFHEYTVLISTKDELTPLLTENIFFLNGTLPEELDASSANTLAYVAFKAFKEDIFYKSFIDHMREENQRLILNLIQSTPTMSLNAIEQFEYFVNNFGENTYSQYLQFLELYRAGNLDEGIDRLISYNERQILSYMSQMNDAFPDLASLFSEMESCNIVCTRGEIGGGSSTGGAGSPFFGGGRGGGGGGGGGFLGENPDPDPDPTPPDPPIPPDPPPVPIPEPSTWLTLGSFLLFLSLLQKKKEAKKRS